MTKNRQRIVVTNRLQAMKDTSTTDINLQALKVVRPHLQSHLQAVNGLTSKPFQSTELVTPSTMGTHLTVSAHFYVHPKRHAQQILAALIAFIADRIGRALVTNNRHEASVCGGLGQLSLTLVVIHD